MNMSKLVILAFCIVSFATNMSYAKENLEELTVRLSPYFFGKTGTDLFIAH